jgi:hypothetical protein
MAAVPSLSALVLRFFAQTFLHDAVTDAEDAEGTPTCRLPWKPWG